MKKGIFALIGIVLVLALVLGFKIINTKKNTSYTPAQIKEKILLIRGFYYVKKRINWCDCGDN